MTAILERETIRGILTIPDPSGGKVLTWDPQDALEAAQAEDAFRAALKGGMVAHQLHAGGSAADGTMGTVTRRFPEEAAEIVMRPQLVGG
jgi:hypothetical protein